MILGIQERLCPSAAQTKEETGPETSKAYARVSSENVHRLKVLSVQGDVVVYRERKQARQGRLRSVRHLSPAQRRFI